MTKSVEEKNDLISYYGKRLQVGLDCGDVCIVEQHHEEMTNINKIVGRYRKTGILPQVGEPKYADVSEVGDLLDTKMQMDAAMEAYYRLPQAVRDNFADAQDFAENAIERSKQLQKEAEEQKIQEDKESHFEKKSAAREQAKNENNYPEKNPPKAD